MKYIVNEFHPNNLVDIRKEHEFSQKELGEILGVSSRQICNYETGERSLPIDKAMILSEKFNYSLDWIYSRTERKKEINTFKVDIRNFFSCDDDNVYLTIPKNFWDYIHTISEIEKSTNTQSAKSLLKFKAYSEYDKDNNDKIVFRITMPKEDFSAYIQSKDGLLPYSSEHENRIPKHRPTEEETKQIVDFFESLNKSE